MNDSEYAARLRGLVAQLRELERSAGIADAADRWRNPADSAAIATHEPKSDESGAERPLGAYSFLLDDNLRHAFRTLYFGVAHPALRKSLIVKQRELALFERTAIRTQLEDARRHRKTLARRPSEGWWIAAIVGASLVIVGYMLFAIAGAVAGGVAALFVGNGIEQSARRRFEHAVVDAEEELSFAAVASTTAEQAQDLFSERESMTGVPDSASEAAGKLTVNLH